MVSRKKQPDTFDHEHAEHTRKQQALERGVRERKDGLSVLRDLVAGSSPLTAERMRGVETDKDVDHFLIGNGFDVHDKSGQPLKHLMEMFKKALAYLSNLEASISDNVKKLCPESFEEHMNEERCRGNLYKLFFWASGKSTFAHDRASACAVLRVMNTIMAVDRNPRMQHADAAYFKLRDIKDKMCFQTRPDGKLHFRLGYKKENEGNSLPIVSIEVRIKEHEALVRKTLNNPRYTADPIYDIAGIRIVCKNKQDIIKILMALVEQKILLSNVVIPEESKDKMFDLVVALTDDKKMDDFLRKYLTDTLEDEGEMITKDSEVSLDSKNPFSSSGYKAVHISVFLPVQTAEGKIVNIPVEWQFVDAESYKRQERSSGKDEGHGAYRARQINAIRTKVFTQVPEIKN